MADTGWVSAGLGQNIDRGQGDWATPTNIYTSNNAYAEIDIPPEGLSDWLRATTFGFSIPAGSTINGIEARFEKRAENSLIRDWDTKIVKAGSEQGDDKGQAGWPTTDTYVVYGGAADLWGLTWTPAEINASNFGVSISARSYSPTTTYYALVDHVQIKVYYTPPSTNMKINIGDVFKDVDEVKINIADSWKTVTEVWINIGDVWKQVF